MLSHGKVCDIYPGDRADLLNIAYSDRISCFNQAVGEIAGRGSVLSAISAEMFRIAQRETNIPTHFVSHQNNTITVRRCQPIKIEIIVRGYIAGSLWRHYSKHGGPEGEKIVYCGVEIPPGLKQFDQIPGGPIITPTAKSDTDPPLSKDEIISTGLLSKEETELVYSYALELFDLGTRIANQKRKGHDQEQGYSYILADTKFEFGRNITGQICLIDELLTCDSSRYWIKDKNNAINNLDKDIVRDWVKEHPDTPLPEKLKILALAAYRRFLSDLMQINY